MLSHYGMNAANGIYSMAYRIIDVATIPILAIREAAMPRFFLNGLGGIRGTAKLAALLLKRALPLGALAAGIVFMTAPLVPYLAGKGFHETISALRWLCLIPLLRSLHQMSGSAITGSGLQRYRTLSQMLAVSLNFGLNVWLIPRHGWLGAAWSSLATDGTLAVINCAMLAVLYQLAGQAELKRNAHLSPSPASQSGVEAIRARSLRPAGWLRYGSAGSRCRENACFLESPSPAAPVPGGALRRRWAAITRY